MVRRERSWLRDDPQEEEPSWKSSLTQWTPLITIPEPAVTRRNRSIIYNYEPQKRETPRPSICSTRETPVLPLHKSSHKPRPSFTKVGKVASELSVIHLDFFVSLFVLVLCHARLVYLFVFVMVSFSVWRTSVNTWCFVLWHGRDVNGCKCWSARPCVGPSRNELEKWSLSLRAGVWSFRINGLFMLIFHYHGF